MRKDSWTSEDDSLLAMTVLDAIRAGKTQLQAFEEVEKVNSRTSAACGFRWNSEVRKSYEEELKQAKVEGKANRRSSDVSKTKEPESATVKEAATPFEVVSGVDILDTLLAVVNEVIATVKAIQKDNEKLQRENTKLRNKLEDKPNSEDLNALLQLIERAKTLGLMTDRNPAM